MWHPHSNSVYCSALAPVISLNGLAKFDGNDDGAVEFELADPSADTTALYEKYEVRTAVVRFLRSLKPRERQVIKEVYWQERSQADVARRHGVSPAAVSKIIGKVNATGRKRLAEYRRWYFRS